MAVKQLSDGHPDGTNIGQNSSDKVGMHAVTPVVRYSLTLVIADGHTTTATLSTAFNELKLALKNKGIIDHA